MKLSYSLLGVFVLAALAPCVARALGRAAGWVLSLGPIAFFALLLSFGPRVFEGAVVRESIAWAPSLGLNVTLALDGLGLLFALLISGVGALVLIYAQGYLDGHRHVHRMHAFLLMFMGSMLGVVLSDNLLVLFVFWELTSVSSYLLIGFDHDRLFARKAALQALLVTGGGGLAMLVGILLLGAVAGTYDVTALMTQAGSVRAHGQYAVIVVLIAAGCFTKSAQFPFHFWLPGAMEAPTPVSAYLHSCTMVKAGIFFLARLSPVLGGNGLWSGLLTAFGAVTMVLGAVIAFRQTYLKKLLAYSTVSSLGIMVMSIGIGTPAAVEAGITYLFAHALFKGSLFMTAGAIDHGTGERDIERLGGLFRAMPLLALIGVVAALSMAGVGPTFGFVGKELLLEALMHGPRGAVVLTLALLVTAALTVAVAVMTAVKPFFGPQLPTPHEPHAPGLSLLAGPGVLAGLGLAATFWPATLVDPFVSAAARAVTETNADFHLVLWHGFTVALVLSAVAFAGGIAVYVYRERARAVFDRYRGIERFGPANGYEILLRGLMAVAEGQTAVLQNGNLRSYLFITVGAAAALVGYTLLTRAELSFAHVSLDVRWYELAIAGVIAIAALATVLARTRLAAITSLGLAGYGVSIMFIMFGAPDLAMTQIAIDTLTVILFVLVFLRLPDFRVISSRGERLRDLVVAVMAGVLMTVLVTMASSVPDRQSISSWFGEQSVPAAHGRNVVNVILVDFRALDTLGEITVLGIAALGVFALLRSGSSRKGCDA